MGMVSLTGVAYLLVRIVTPAFPAQFFGGFETGFYGENRACAIRRLFVSGSHPIDLFHKSR